MDSHTQRSCLKALIGFLSAPLLIASPIATFAQATTPDAHSGAPHDWSHRHLIYSNVDTHDEAARKGTLAFEEWKNKIKDPRYALQVARKTRFVESTEDSPFSPQERQWANRRHRDLPQTGASIHADWSTSLGTAAVRKAGIFPAKWNFDISATVSAANCTSDFVVYATDANGSATRPTIVAFNNLYATTCTGTNPLTYWSYNTGTGSRGQTSPVLSLGGTQVAFIQGAGATGTTAQLVLLKWKSGTGTVAAPAVPKTAATAGDYGNNLNNCTPANQPCMLVLSLSGGPAVTMSSPFYDYAGDNLYVGDDSGSLHKFTGVFKGTPAEVGSPWPVLVSSGNILSSPVYDSASGLVFIGSAATTTTGGQLHSIISNCVSNCVVSSGRLASSAAANSGVRDAPIVDSTAAMVYAFVGSDSGAIVTNFCNTVPCAAIYQFPTNFAGNSMGTRAVVGRGVANTTTGVLYGGTFDNAYYTSTGGSPPGSKPSGNLYVCGSLAATIRRPTFWQIPITANAMGTPVVGPNLTSAAANCSPVTEIMNGTNDYLFVSVTAGGQMTGGATACTTACVYSFDLSTLTWGTGLGLNTAKLTAAGGTSGIIVDNISSTTGASQIYYSDLANPGNAVQASQAALQ